MRELIRKLQKVTTSYSSVTDVQLQRPLLLEKNEFNNRKKGSGSPPFVSLFSVSVPHGYVPVYVGKGSTRFIIKTRFLNYPILAELLQRSAQEYGYEQQGGLRIPCDVVLFQHILCLLNSDDRLATELRLTDLPDFCESR